MFMASKQPPLIQIFIAKSAKPAVRHLESVVGSREDSRSLGIPSKEGNFSSSLVR